MKNFMKLSFTCIALLLFSSFTLLESIRESEHEGRWKGEDNSGIAFITLSSDGYATFESKGGIMGGKSYDYLGVEASMKYIVDTEKSPKHIDFIIVDNSSQEMLGRLEGIFRLNSKDQMELAITFGADLPRPKDFLSESLVLTRVK